MKRQTYSGLVIAILIVCLVVCGIPSTFAKPHEDLTFEPIEFKPPVPEKRMLSNGMVLYLLEDHELPLFNINGLIKTGDIYDPADKVGLSSIFATVMRTGGTVSREPDALNEELESMAASVEVGMSREYGTINLSTLAEDIEKGLEIFSDVLRHPAFREDKLELRKQQSIERIRRRNDDPIRLAWRNFSALLYGIDHPFGRYTEIEGIESITVNDLKAFHAKYYHPDNMMLAITGDFDTETLIAQLEKVFEGWESAEIAFPDVPTVDATPKASVNYIFKDLPQSVMLIGHFGIKRTPDFPDYFALRVMNDILGEGGFTSRLMKEVREKHGLAYMVGSIMQTSYYTNPGEWFAYSQTRTDKTAEAISLIIDVVKGLRDAPVPEAELQRTKDSLINSFVFGFESSAQIAFQQMMLAYRGFAPDFLETFTDNIAKVTAEDVQAVAQKYLHPDALTIVTVGNKDSFDRPLAEFGEVNEIEIEQPAPPPPAEPMPEASEADMAKAKEILAAAVEAHGGLEKLQAVKNAVMEIDISANSQAGPMQVDAKLYYFFPDKFRQDLKLPQGEMAYVYDGSAAYAMTPMGVQPIPPQMADAFKDSIFRETVWLLANLSQNDIPIQYAGTEDVQGKPASILLIPQPSGEMLKVFVSDETHYVVKYAYREASQGVVANRENLMDDYRDVDGVKIAYHTVQNIDGQLFSEGRVKGVTLNAELDASLFQEPE
ncbi:MAG: pitrilysin family protein [Candidatus Poribacteria bacterium]|nr:pitrilysin family protein [Candidatus Poribacteria bacterium]